MRDRADLSYWGQCCAKSGSTNSTQNFLLEQLSVFISVFCSSLLHSGTECTESQSGMCL